MNSKPVSAKESSRRSDVRPGRRCPGSDPKFSPNQPSPRKTSNKRLLSWLFSTLSKEFRRVDKETISEAVSSAFRSYCNRPRQFRKTPGLPLEYHLLFEAAHNLAKVFKTAKLPNKRLVEPAAQHASH